MAPQHASGATDSSPGRIVFLRPRFPLLRHRSGGSCWTGRVRVWGQISERIFLADFVYGKERTQRWKHTRHDRHGDPPRRKPQGRARLPRAGLLETPPLGSAAQSRPPGGGAGLQTRQAGEKRRPRSSGLCDKKLAWRASF